MKNSMVIPEKMPVLFKRCLIRTMVAFMDFCNKHQITYFATGGTAIGAIRHKGFIPWDDDIDVCMLRKDYDRFLKLRKECTGMGYAIIDYHEKGNYIPYAKFVNMNTTLIEFDYHQHASGVFIDIFPLDNVVDDFNVTKEIKKKIMRNVQLYKRTTFDLSWGHMWKYICNKHLNTVSKVLKYKLIYHHQHDKYINILEKDESLLRNIEGDHILNYYTLYKLEKEIFPKEWFADTVEVTFEDIKIKLPVGYHQYLTKLFGDYMTPPPDDKQVSHHSKYYCNLKEHLTLSEIKERLNKGEKYVY
jgi:lipopolysaccharide cholinephosphotransferase